MNFSNLPKIVERPKKRVGRGHGSGKVKTSGRGTKGQKARGTIRPGFEGGQLALIKRLPYLRGKGRNASQKPKAYPVATSALNSLPGGSTVTLELLKKHGIIHAKVTRVKILGSADLTHALKVTVPCSLSAKKSIEKAGGTAQA